VRIIEFQSISIQQVNKLYYSQGWARYSKISIEILDTRYLDLEYRGTRYSILHIILSRYKIQDTIVSKIQHTTYNCI